MERLPTSILTTLAVSLLALTLIAPGVRGQDPDRITEIQRQAEQGDADAQNNLGVMYGEGSRVPQDHAEAVRWFRIAAEQGHARAQLNLGAMYSEGRGVPQDAAEAERWFRLAVEQGDPDVQGFLGAIYFDGEGVPQDHAEAVRWFRMAAEQGHAPCAVLPWVHVRQWPWCAQGRC